MGRSFSSRNGRRIVRGHLVLAVLLISSGCGVFSRETSQERAIRRAVQRDQSFTVEQIPAEAPPHRAASFRLAAEGYRDLQGGQMEKAEDRLEQALSIDPRNPFCYLYMAEIRYRQGDPRQAIILLHQGEVLFQGHPYWLGEAYALEGRSWEALDAWEKAKDAYRKALEYNPSNEEARQKTQ